MKVITENNSAFRLLERTGVAGAGCHRRAHRPGLVPRAGVGADVGVADGTRGGILVLAVVPLKTQIKHTREQWGDGGIPPCIPRKKHLPCKGLFVCGEAQTMEQSLLLLLLFFFFLGGLL